MGTEWCVGLCPLLGTECMCVGLCPLLGTEGCVGLWALSGVFHIRSLLPSSSGRCAIAVRYTGLRGHITVGEGRGREGGWVCGVRREGGREGGVSGEGGRVG